MEQTNYTILNNRLKALCEKQDYFVTNLSNASAALWQAMSEINWAGFYLMKDGVLVLGPFQGKPACVRIEVGKGVCGTAVYEDKVQRVADVHEFPGHIACDSASRSEIVIPIHQDGKIVGVLDIDSPVTERFCAEDEAGLLAFVRVLEETTRFTGI
ncbi:MAG: GAF domain-containing protein [Eubacteriales bacterium]|nr:GAF domain-containing protein [Eubacteriales bacterium]